ncbi:MAG TPA: flippase [Lentimicrobium sp.]|nr:flippase [Lentimicrobium sp.]
MATRSYLEDISSVLGSNVFTLFANLGLVVLLTRLLGTEGYGLYTALLVIPTLVVSFFQMGIRPTTVFLLGSSKENEHEIVSAMLTVLVFTSALGILFSFGAYLLTGTRGYTPMLIGMALLTIPMRLTTIYTGGVFLGKEEIPLANRMNWLTGILTLAITGLLVFVLGLALFGAVLSLLLGNAIVALNAFFLLKKRFRIRISLHNKLILRMLGKGVFYALSFLTIQLNYRIDVVLLKVLSTPSEIGIYSLGVSVAELLWQIPLAVGVVVMSRTANSTDQQAINQSTARLLRISLVIGLALSAGIVLLSPWVVPLVFGSGYLPSVRVMQAIMPGILMIIVFRILSGQLAGAGRPDAALKAFAPALLLNVALNYLWIPQYGANGAVVATNVSYTLASVIYLFVFSRISRMPLKELFRFRKEDWNFVQRLLDAGKQRLKDK